MCNPSHSYFHRAYRTFYPPPPRHITILTTQLLLWISSHPFAILSFIHYLLVHLFNVTLSIPPSRFRKTQMYASRLCNVPTSTHPFCSLNNIRHYTPKYWSPQAGTTRNLLFNTAFIDRGGNFVNQVREQWLPRTARVHRVVRV